MLWILQLAFMKLFPCLLCVPDICPMEKTCVTEKRINRKWYFEGHGNTAHYWTVRLSRESAFLCLKWECRLSRYALKRFYCNKKRSRHTSTCCFPLCSTYQYVGCVQVAVTNLVSTCSALNVLSCHAMPGCLVKTSKALGTFWKAEDFEHQLLKTVPFVSGDILSIAACLRLSRTQEKILLQRLHRASSTQQFCSMACAIVTTGHQCYWHSFALSVAPRATYLWRNVGALRTRQHGSAFASVELPRCLYTVFLSIESIANILPRWTCCPRNVFVSMLWGSIFISPTS